MRLGALDEALATFSALEKHYPFGAPIMRFIVACELAEVFAFKGDLEAAESWLKEARHRKDPSYHQQDLVVEAVIRVLGGDDEALAAWALDHVKAEKVIANDNSLRLLHLWRAFALHRIGKDAAQVQEALRAIIPARLEELEHFIKFVPALEAFVLQYKVLG